MIGPTFPEVLAAAQTGAAWAFEVVYRDLSEASLVPPEWHGWLHYTVDVPPTEESYHAQPWQRPYVPNRTGSPEAYRPPGSILNPDAGKTRQRDYEPWQPGPSK